MDITRLKRGTDNRKITTWPGCTEKIYIRVLSEADYIESEEHVDNSYSKERGVNLGNIDERSALKDTYCLYLAVVDEFGSRIFPDFPAFAGHCTPEVRAILIEAQNEWQAECAPVIDEMPEKEVDELLSSIKKNIETVRSITDSRLLRKLITTMVSREQGLPTAS